VPFFIEGLPYNWGPFDMLKAASRALLGIKSFKLTIRLGPPIYPAPGGTDYVQLTERVRDAVLQLAN
jgi:hypothetical protein